MLALWRRKLALALPVNDQNPPAVAVRQATGRRQARDRFLFSAIIRPLHF